MAQKDKAPRISVNKLGEYMTVKAGRQNRILHDAKYPQDYITPYYREATDAIAKCIADGMQDLMPLDNAIKLLGQKTANCVQEGRRVEGNIDAIENFINMVDRIELKGGEPKLGAHQAPHITCNGVSVSVRPEITLHAKKRSGVPLVGGIKLHFPKTFPLNEDAAQYISTALQFYCNDHLIEDGASSYEHCFVLDIGTGQVFDGVKAIVARRRDIEQTCRQIASLWPTV